MESTDSPRARLSKSLRYEILRRDNHTCRYCGGTAPDVKLTVDHVMPVALGGPSAPGNLVAACADCNAGKKATPPGAPLVEDVKQDEVRWRRAASLAAQTMGLRADERTDYVYDFWLAWTGGGTIRGYPLPEGYENSICRLFDAQLPSSVVVECVVAANAAQYVYDDNRFRYFMGIALNRVRDLQELARSILEAEENGDPWV